jgi:glucokinase
VDESRGEVPILVDVPQWGKITEEEITKSTGIVKVKLMNDFVANAYGITGLHEKPDDILKIF